MSTTIFIWRDKMIPTVDISQRITILETKIPYVVDEINFLSNQIKDLDAKVDALNTNVAIIIDQRDKSDKSLSRWKTGAIAACSTLAVALILFLLKISWMVQSARALTN